LLTGGQKHFLVLALDFDLKPASMIIALALYIVEKRLNTEFENRRR